MDAETFGAELRRDGYTDIETKTAMPGVSSPPHSHPCAIRALVIRGELTLECNGSTRTYRAGDVVALDAGCEHAEHHGPEGYTYIVGRRMLREGDRNQGHLRPPPLG